METWKTIPDYTLYKISDRGRLKTFNWKGSGREAIMKPALDGCGYLRTMIKSDKGCTHTVKMHRLVLLAFVGTPKDGLQCNHKNGIRNDNRLINLEWVTPSENSKHSFKIGLNSNRGELNPAATLTDQQVIEIRRNYQYGRKSRHDGGKTKKQIAKEYNTTVNVIKFIIQGRTWKHLL